MPSRVEMKKAERPFAGLMHWLEPPEVFHIFEGVRPFDDRMRIEEEVVGDRLVIRAEIPGVDPEKDVEINVADGVLSARAERREEEGKKTDGGFRSEFR
jgi:HSP20 family molecular chaperone IbpA